MSNKEVEIELGDIDIFDDTIDEDESNTNKSSLSQVSVADSIEDHVQQIQRTLQ